MEKILDAVGLEEIPCEIGKKPFSKFHEVHPDTLNDGKYDEGVIREVVQRGLRYKDNPENVLKPALVKIQGDKKEIS